MSSIIESLLELDVPTPIKARLPSEDEIRSMEEQLCTTFPNDYKEFLQKASNVFVGTLEPANITSPNSHNFLPGVVEQARQLGLPNSLIPFCEDNSDFYCFNVAGQVVYWSHNGTTNESWSSFTSWVQRVWVGESA